MNSKTKKIFDYILSPTIILILISLLLTVIVDSISRGSIYESLNFIKNRPMTFLFNSTIVLITLSITLLTKRKIFSYSIISSIWIISAISNNVIVNLRGTPLTGNDLRLIKSGLKLMNNYLSNKEIISIILLLFILIVLLILIFKFAPKSKFKINYFLSFGLITIIFIIYKLFNGFAVNSSIVSNNFWDLEAVYSENGFIYCFSTTLINNGVSEPDSYSENFMESIYYTLEDSLVSSSNNLSLTNSSNDEKELPNILMIQLESFLIQH